MQIPRSYFPPMRDGSLKGSFFFCMSFPGKSERDNGRLTFDVMRIISHLAVRVWGTRTWKSTEVKIMRSCRIEFRGRLTIT